MKFFLKIPNIINTFIKNNKIYFNGILGTECLNFFPFNVKIYNNKLEISKITKNNLKYCQTFIGLIKQIIKGILIGYNKELKLVGTGFRCEKTFTRLKLKLGFSHLISKKIPIYLKIYCKKKRFINIKGKNIQKINEFSHNIQKIKFPNVYTEKGIFFKNQKIIKKQGKKI
jgi:large subunit ribosomal protein L6